MQGNVVVNGIKAAERKGVLLNSSAPCQDHKGWFSFLCSLYFFYFFFFFSSQLFSVTIPSPITTSVSAVVSSPSLTTQETTLSTISSDAASAPLTGPVFGPSLPFLWSAALVPKKELPMKCDRCQYSNDSMYELRVHREKKHRLWECLRCDKTFHNQRSFDKHNPGPAKWSFDCDLHPFAQVIWSEYF